MGQKLAAMRVWVGFGLGLLGSVLGLLGFVKSRSNAETMTRIQVGQLLNEAGDLLGGAEGSTVLVMDQRRGREARQRLELARRKIDEALALDDEHPRAHMLMGDYFHLSGSPGKSLAAYQRAAALAPDSPDAWNGIGLGHYARGELDEAATAFRKALELDERHPFARNNLGSLLVDQGKLEEAEASYRAAIALDPSNPVMHVNLGRLLVLLERPLDAEAAYRGALQVDPGHAAAWAFLAALLHQTGQPDLEAYERAVALHGGDPETQFGLGRALALAGRAVEATAPLKQAVTLDPEHALAWSFLASVLAEQELAAPSIAAYKRAVRLAPDDATTWFDYAVSMTTFAGPEEAEPLFRKALEIDDSTADAWQGLGEVLEDLGRSDEAKKAQARAAALRSPQDK